MVAHTTVSICGFNRGLAQGIRPKIKLRVFLKTFFPNSCINLWLKKNSTPSNYGLLCTVAICRGWKSHSKIHPSFFSAFSLFFVLFPVKKVRSICSARQKHQYICTDTVTWFRVWNLFARMTVWQIDHKPASNNGRCWYTTTLSIYP